MEMFVSLARLVRISSYHHEERWEINLKRYFMSSEFPVEVTDAQVITFKVLMCVASVDLT